MIPFQIISFHVLYGYFRFSVSTASLDEGGVGVALGPPGPWPWRCGGRWGPGVDPGTYHIVFPAPCEHRLWLRPLLDFRTCPLFSTGHCAVTTTWIPTLRKGNRKYWSQSYIWKYVRVSWPKFSYSFIQIYIVQIFKKIVNTRLKVLLTREIPSGSYSLRILMCM